MMNCWSLDMVLRKINTIVVLSVLLATASPALAHVGISDASHLSSGFLHPLRGLDHILAMIAVGLYACQLGGRNIWLVPLAFGATMIFGGLLGYVGFPLPYVEHGIGISIVIIGLAIASGVKLPTAAATTLVGLFAAFHGHAHGTEGAGLGVSFLPYAAGFVVATALLHCFGVAIGLGLQQRGGRTALIAERALGVCGAIVGAALLAGWIAT
jgi:urease accessory protein